MKQKKLKTMIRNYNLDTIKFENLDEIENFLRKPRILKFDVIGVKKFILVSMEEIAFVRNLTHTKKVTMPSWIHK